MSETKVTVRRNGPYLVEGSFTLVDADGVAFGLGGRTRVALCSCGQSQDKPFCDGTHGRVGFTCARQARDLPPLASPPAGAPPSPS
jgi:CDGSH-type Zn-finger protein